MTVKPPLRRMTAKQRTHQFYMADALRQLEWDLHRTIDAGGRIPPMWHDIAQSPGPGKKRKVTLWIEEDVLRFFRSMGRGQGARMEAVLRAFVHARLAGLIKGPGTINPYRGDPAHEGPRPDWGSTAHELGLTEGPDNPDADPKAAAMAELRAQMGWRQAEEEGW